VGCGRKRGEAVWRQHEEEVAGKVLVGESVREVCRHRVGGVCGQRGVQAAGVSVCWGVLAEAFHPVCFHFSISDNKNYASRKTNSSNMLTIESLSELEETIEEAYLAWIYCHHSWIHRIHRHCRQIHRCRILIRCRHRGRIRIRQIRRLRHLIRHGWGVQAWGRQWGAGASVGRQCAAGASVGRRCSSERERVREREREGEVCGHRVGGVCGQRGACAGSGALGCVG